MRVWCLEVEGGSGTETHHYTSEKFRAVLAFYIGVTETIVL